MATESHTKIFFEHEKPAGDESYTAEVLSRFMTRAWRRPVTEEEIERKLTLYSKIRPDCESFEEAMIEVLATVIASLNSCILYSPVPRKIVRVAV